jgi:hypothetical protein
MAIADAWSTDLFPGSFLEHVIRALAANDACELNRLLQIAEDIGERRSQSLPQILLDESRMRLFSSVLTETSRNVRLLRRVYGRTGGIKSLTRQVIS